MNYRASDTHPNGYYQQLIKDIKEGNTPGQVQRNFLQKALLVGGSSALTGLAGVVSSAHSSDQADRLAERHRKDAAAAALRTAPHVPSAPPQENYSNDEYGLPRAMGPAGPDYKMSMDHAVMSGNDAAKAALANQSMNSAAKDTTLGGYDTSEGIKNRVKLSDSLTRDTVNGQDMIRNSGGMMSSLQRQRLPDDGGMGPLR